MPVSTRNSPVAQKQIDILLGHIIKKGEEHRPLRQPGGISDATLATYGIRRIPLDFETLEDENYNLSLEPPVLFAPQPLSVLNEHPVDPSIDEMWFRDYNPPSDPEEREKGWWEPLDCARGIETFLDLWSRGCWRPGAINLREQCGLRHIRVPNPFLLLNPCPGNMWPPPESRWSLETTLESLPNPQNPDNNMTAHPHLILMTILGGNGKEGSILAGELASIIVTMYNRLHQPETYGEEDEEDLMENAKYAEARSRKRAFPTEGRFPILLISLMGPQHARLSYACMDDAELVIRQSKLYSFEVGDTAPWDFFSRFALSRPLTESSRKLPVLPSPSFQHPSPRDVRSGSKSLGGPTSGPSPELTLVLRIKNNEERDDLRS
ncbi:hypothetical protein FQN54_003753 [Arachnomyces sp. PD_36]|nr:hypothetical protein FQN54_003753 [Arachnomyces sp. PD_36]